MCIRTEVKKYLIHSQKSFILYCDSEWNAKVVSTQILGFICFPIIREYNNDSTNSTKLLFNIFKYIRFSIIYESINAPRCESTYSFIYAFELKRINGFCWGRFIIYDKVQALSQTSPGHIHHFIMNFFFSVFSSSFWKINTHH